MSDSPAPAPFASFDPHGLDISLTDRWELERLLAPLYPASVTSLQCVHRYLSYVRRGFEELDRWRSTQGAHDRPEA